MPSLRPQPQLAATLQRAQRAAASHLLRTDQLTRADRTLLQRRGFLVEIVRGWYALTTPQAQPGDTAFWQFHFWAFVSAYLHHRYGSNYCLSAEHSLDLWAGATQTPKQLIVTTTRSGVFTLRLPNQSSILIYPGRKPLPANLPQVNGVSVMPLATALLRVTATYFQHSATNAELVLRMVRPEEVSRALLSDETNRAAAARIIGALDHLGLTEAARRIADDLAAAAAPVRPENPFLGPPQIPPAHRFTSPSAGRIEALWSKMRPDVLAHFPAPPRRRARRDQLLKRVREIYTHDAYNSLSIEGYQVTPELIAKVATGQWDPAADPADQSQVDAMAARGYHEAFQRVVGSLREVLGGANPGTVLRRDLQDWYRALFSPSVQAGIIPASALAGYRERRVFIRGSEHVPPNLHVVPELMDTLFRLLESEPSPAARAVLGHFGFVFIHPYADGNGRIGRFLMNVMLSSGGYNWTVVRHQQRPAYMAALEQASVHGTITPLCRFLAGELKASAKLGP